MEMLCLNITILNNFWDNGGHIIIFYFNEIKEKGEIFFLTRVKLWKIDLN